MATIADVARRAGVSTTAVSFVLNGRLDQLGAETIERIRAAIRELDYKPSAIAKALATRRTETIGVIVTHLVLPVETFIASDGYMVYKGTNHPDAAVKFLLFLVSPEAQLLQMQLANLQPARLSLGAAYATETEGAARGINMKVFIDQTAYARPAPLFVNQQQVMDLRWPFVDRMLYRNEIPVRQGMIEWAQTANSRMAEAQTQ